MIILVGLPASGKSSVYNKICSDLVQVSLDVIKTRAKEIKLLQSIFNEGKDLVIDNTNASISERKRYLDLAKEHGYKTVCVWMDTPKEECLKRNKIRSNRVPDIAIHTIAKRFEDPTKSEGFTGLIKISM